MEFKWYWPAEIMGLVTELTPQADNGYATWQVSARADEVFFTIFLLAIPALFLLGAALRALLSPNAGRTAVRLGAGALLLYAVLQAVGVGPYVQFYPQGGGFLDLTALEHILSGLYTALLALSLVFGGRFGRFLRDYCKKRKETP